MADHADALARLAVVAGVNVAPGQTVSISAKLGQEPLARAVARAAYERGAHQVHVDYRDPHLAKIRYESAPAEALGKVLPWVRSRPDEMAAIQSAWIGLSGPT